MFLFFCTDVGSGIAVVAGVVVVVVANAIAGVIQCVACSVNANAKGKS